MAVPTGAYDVSAVIDLPPPFGSPAGAAKLDLVKPGPDALLNCLARLHSSERGDIYSALDELPFFTESGDRVVPVLIRIALDERADGRYRAIYGLLSFPDQAASFTPALLEILGREEEASGAAASVLAEVGVPIDRVKQALETARNEGDKELSAAARAALDTLAARPPVGLSD